jgi:FSR family fosmidomycin resistance protein-like MFS transporter
LTGPFSVDDHPTEIMNGVSTTEQTAPMSSARLSSRTGLTLAVATLAHFVHDGFSDALYVLLPVWARQFGLAYAQVGLLKMLYTGAMSLAQVPLGLAAERLGERGLLGAGTIVTAGGFLAVAAWGAGFPSIALLLFVAGAASGVQHPLASSLVSKAYETGRRRAALGTYNFSGDLGKVAAAGAVGVATAAFGWRTACAGYGVAGLIAAVVIWGTLARVGAGGASAPGPAEGRTTGWGIRDGRGFGTLSAIGVIDTATRSGFLMFLPFALAAKGATTAGVGAALAVLFAGGAAGKLVCGLVAERIGIVRTVVITEAATALGIVAVVSTPLSLSLAVLLPLGIALNGTSSVLYATVADLVAAERRSRAYGLYYTITLGASAVAPFVYGVAGDLMGVAATLVLVAAVVLITIPLCVTLRRLFVVRAATS